MPNMSCQVSPVLDNGTTFDASNAYERSEEGVISTVPYGSEFYEAMVDAIEACGDSVEPARSTSHLAAVSSIPINCADACGIVDWHPSFISYVGTF